MTKLNDLAQLEVLKRREALAAAEAECEANKQAQIDAMYAAREKKISDDRKAQMGMLWSRKY